MTATRKRASAAASQDVCIDLPGEPVRCWRSSDNLKVVLRKHRDVFFDINLNPGATYVVESKEDFYVPYEKKLVKKVQFQDGERLHVWIGRDFKGSFVLKNGASVMGEFAAAAFDQEKYGADPKIKPEPLLIILGSRQAPISIFREIDNPNGVRGLQYLFDPYYDPKVAILKNYGAKNDFSCRSGKPEVEEYICITEADSTDIHENVLKKLESGEGFDRALSEIFYFPTSEKNSSKLYAALAATIATISGNEYLTSNWFKEAAGYTQEHWRQLNRILSRVRIEKKVKGKYKVAFKGRLLTEVAAQIAGSGAQAKIAHKRVSLGSSSSAFLDGGFGRSGKAGYGGFRRMVLTASSNFRDGAKIQIIGTVIDIMGDVDDVYFKEEGSKDLSEFLGRAGVSIVKAGATAALGSVLTAVGVAVASVLFVGGLPVAVGMLVVVGAFIVAAYAVDALDRTFEIKKSVAQVAR